MSLPPKFPFSDVVLSEGTASVGATPIAAVCVAHCAGILRKVYASAGGTTTGTIAVAVTVNAGSDVTGGLLTIAAGSNARNNAGVTLPHTGAGVIAVNEGDIITFTPSGGGGASIPGAFAAVIRKT
jgi:hypothetical protein